ncbi:MAG: hypothetical protein KAJ19_14620, partial [Gammaproteobacteria bacterium]|nr:hypothetical protein [Gammaproteobacteria bacterium]
LIIGETAFFILNYGGIRRKKYPMGRYLWKPVAAGLAMAGIALIMHWTISDQVSNLYIAFVAVIAYALLVIVMGIFTKSDRHLFKEVLFRDKSQ